VPDHPRCHRWTARLFRATLDLQPVPSHTSHGKQGCEKGDLAVFQQVFSAALVVGALASQAEAVTYDFTPVTLTCDDVCIVPSVTVSGTVTTDGTLGSLVTSNFLSVTAKVVTLLGTTDYTNSDL
jgi:hypothetical protein